MFRRIRCWLFCSLMPPVGAPAVCLHASVCSVGPTFSSVAFFLVFPGLLSSVCVCVCVNEIRHQCSCVVVCCCVRTYGTWCLVFGDTLFLIMDLQVCVCVSSSSCMLVVSRANHPFQHVFPLFPTATRKCVCVWRLVRACHPVPPSP